MGDPTVSPDGKTVVVWANSVQATSGGLYAIEVSSGKSHLISPDDDADVTYTDAAFSPDGQRLAYRKDLGDGTHAIFTADFSAANTALDEDRLTEYDHDSDPSWSPDGSRIVFNRTTSDGIWRLLRREHQGRHAGRGGRWSAPGGPRRSGLDASVNGEPRPRTKDPRRAS